MGRGRLKTDEWNATFEALSPYWRSVWAAGVTHERRTLRRALGFYDAFGHDRIVSCSFRRVRVSRTSCEKKKRRTMSLSRDINSLEEKD